MKSRNTHWLKSYASVMAQSLMNSGINRDAAERYVTARILNFNLAESAISEFSMQVLQQLKNRGILFEFHFDEEAGIVADSVSPAGICYDKIRLCMKHDSLSHGIVLANHADSNSLLQEESGDSVYRTKLEKLRGKYSQAQGEVSIDNLPDQEEFAIYAAKIAENIHSAQVDIY